MRKRFQLAIASTIALFGLITSTHAQVLTATNNLQLWLKADAGVTTSGSSVTSWADQSTNSNNAAQGTSSFQPILVNNVINGKPVVRFDGTNDVLSIPNSASLNFGSGPFSIFVVFSFTNNINSTYPYGLLFGKVNGVFPFAGPTAFVDLNTGGGVQHGVVQFRITATNAIQNGTTANDLRFRDWEFFDSGTSLSMYSNGVLGATASEPNMNIDNTSPFLIGGQPGAVQPLKGDIAEILMYNTSLTAADRATINEYFFAKYALPEPSSVLLATLSFSLIWMRRRIRL